MIIRLFSSCQYIDDRDVKEDGTIIQRDRIVVDY
jgi:hypothetical protein